MIECMYSEERLEKMKNVYNILIIITFLLLFKIILFMKLEKNTLYCVIVLRVACSMYIACSACVMCYVYYIVYNIFLTIVTRWRESYLLVTV